MGVTRFLKDQTFNHDITNSSAYGSFCKFVMEKVVELGGGMFGTPEVVTDTASSYKAYSQIWGTDLYLQLYNSGSSSMTYGACQKKDGAYVTISDGSLAMSTTFNTSNPSFRIYISNINDCIGAVQICGSQSSCVTNFGYAYSEKQKRNIYIASARGGPDSGIGTTFLSRGLLSGSTPVCLTSAGKRANYHCYGIHEIACKEHMRLSAISYALLPTSYIGFVDDSTNKEDFGRVKWGGLYDMYVLYVPAGPYETNPLTSYNIDGTTYMACFGQLCILKEAA